MTFDGIQHVTESLSGEQIRQPAGFFAIIGIPFSRGCGDGNISVVLFGRRIYKILTKKCIMRLFRELPLLPALAVITTSTALIFGNHPIVR
jgi:hypothetical protein